MEYKLSIIVPIFNSEKFLERTLKSILYQITEEVELVLINDGSTDSSEPFRNASSRAPPSFLMCPL